MDSIQNILAQGRKTLSEHESKQFLASFGIPAAREILVGDTADLVTACKDIGYPLVLKGCSPHLSHKTERGAVRVDIRNEEEALQAFDEIKRSMAPDEVSVLVQELISGTRELMVGLTRDPQFGPCVMFGLGGILTEILKDVAFRVAPLEPGDAMDMMMQIRGRRILEAIRGMEAVDLDAMASILMTVGQIGLENPRIQEIDINPLIIRSGRPVAVDALVVLN
ncbi:MAG: acetate--CoA ligase family protein [Desulfomonilaceae bacterium]|nr:acetate--CoA ligase family protein [Desulfomonilaceae bacterium]